MRFNKIFAVVAICLSFTGCSAVVNEPMSFNVNSAIETIKEEVEQSAGVAAGFNFDYEKGAEKLTNICEKVVEVKNEVVTRVEEATAAKDYSETNTSKTDLTVFANKGANFTVIYKNEVEDSKDTVACYFKYDDADTVTYYYSKNLPKSITDITLFSDDELSPYAVQLKRVLGEWAIYEVGTKATAFDAVRVVATLDKYEDYLKIPCEETFKSGGLYNVADTVSNKVNMESDIFALTDNENDYVVYSYNENGILKSITDFDSLYMVGEVK